MQWAFTGKKKNKHVSLQYKEILIRVEKRCFFLRASKRPVSPNWSESLTPSWDLSQLNLEMCNKKIQLKKNLHLIGFLAVLYT